MQTAEATPGVAVAPLLAVQDAPSMGKRRPGTTTVGVVGMTINLVTGGLGSGILTLAWGMAGASIVVGVLLILLVVALNACTVMILVHASETHKKFDLGALLALLPGRWLGPISQGACNALVWVTLWMTLLGYLIVVQDSMSSLFPADSWLAGRSVWALLGSLVALGLSLVDLGLLSRTSSPLGVAVNCYLFGLLCADLGASGRSPEALCFMARLDPPPRGVISFLSLVSMTIIIQMCILPMYEHLEDRSPQRFRWALGASFSILFVLYAAFATVAYLRFGPTVPANVLKDLGDAGWGDAARVGMSIVVLCVYPLMVKPMVAPVEQLIARRYAESGRAGREEDGDQGGGEVIGDLGGGRRDVGCSAVLAKAAAKLAAVGIAASTMVCAFFVSDLGVINVIAGTVSIGGFVALSPGLVGLCLSDPPQRHEVCWRVTMHALIWGGLSLSLVGLFFRDNYAASLAEACLWKL